MLEIFLYKLVHVLIKNLNKNIIRVDTEIESQILTPSVNENLNLLFSCLLNIL